MRTMLENVLKEIIVSNLFCVAKEKEPEPEADIDMGDLFGGF